MEGLPLPLPGLSHSSFVISHGAKFLQKQLFREGTFFLGGGGRVGASGGGSSMKVSTKRGGSYLFVSYSRGGSHTFSRIFNEDFCDVAFTHFDLVWCLL